MIIRGAGEAFSAGVRSSQPNHAVERSIAKTDGWWSRHVVNNWFEIWDMSTPVIAQVHGWCLAEERSSKCLRPNIRFRRLKNWVPPVV
ncbi:MAG: hypothetical protein CM15mP49_16600 [Actinomycetota bacterium]|nr:MAG: hypothetical protein CM15mP49_16600 [Actinomycetota bacterium]